MMVEWWQSLGWANALIVAVIVIWVALWALRRVFRPRRRPWLDPPDRSCEREWYGDKK